jgi:hypothetical protein
MGTTVPVAKQLAALESVPRDLDAFAPPSRWQKALAEARAAEEARAAAPQTSDQSPDAEVQALMRHPLTAVLSKDGKPIKALIKVMDQKSGRANSRLLAIGDQLDGFTLRSLDSATATFVDQSGTRAVDFDLPVAGEAGGARTASVVGGSG